MCDKKEVIIKNLLNNTFSEKERLELEKHIETCEECRKSYQVLTNASRVYSMIKGSFKAPESFEQDFSKKLENTELPKNAEIKKFKISFKPAVFYISAAAALILCISVIFFQFQKDEIPSSLEPELITSAEVEAGKPVTVEIEYTALRDIADIKMTVFLDNAISFHTENEARKKLKQHTWQGSLKKGVNKIPFVVDVAEKGTWKIKTKAVFEGFIHEHDVILSADKEKIKISYFAYPARKSGDAL